MHGALRFLPALAGLLGAAGVALAAAASHGGDTHLLGNASLMCLVHAPALIAISYLGERNRLVVYPALLLALGTLIFASDLVARHFQGSGLFPMAAPGGGMMMIIGWLSFGAVSLIRPRA